LLPLCSQEKKVFQDEARTFELHQWLMGNADYLNIIARPEDKIEALGAITPGKKLL